MGTLQSSAKALSIKCPALWIGVPLSMAVGMAMYVLTASSIEADSRQRFSAHAPNANIIVARIKSYTDILRGAASIFQTSYPLSRRQFQGYVNGLDARRYFPAIEIINFAEYVKDVNRAAFERRINATHLRHSQHLSDPAPHYPKQIRRDLLRSVSERALCNRN